MSNESQHLRANQSKFDAWAPSYEDRRYDFFRRMQERVLQRLRLTPGMRVLDIGCGTGWAVRRAASAVGSEGQARGVDLSAGMIEQARRASEGIENVGFDQANAEHLPFAGRSFDRILCTMSFHHYLHPDRAVGEMARVLRPGGRVLILDPAADAFFMRWVDAYLRNRDPGHQRMYSSREFRRLFEAAGLRYVESSPIFRLWFYAKAHVGERPRELL